MTSDEWRVFDEAVERVKRVVQEAHGPLAELDESAKQATVAIEAIADLLIDDTCVRCHGSGSIHESVCPICTGHGYHRRDVVVTPGPLTGFEPNGEGGGAR